MPSPLIRYRVDYANHRVVRVECPNGLYPAQDADGHSIYVNSHFETEAEAWADVRADAEYRVLRSGEIIQEIEQKLAGARAQAGAAAVGFSQMCENYAQWEASE